MSAGCHCRLATACTTPFSEHHGCCDTSDMCASQCLMSTCYGNNPAGMMSMYRGWDIHALSILHRACSKVFGTNYPTTTLSIQSNLQNRKVIGGAYFLILGGS